MKRAVWLTALLAAGLTTWASTTRSEVVQKPDFSLALPEGWVEIPQEVLKQTYEAMKQQAPDAGFPRYDYGFQLESAEKWMAYPYVLVQISNTARISEHELQSLQKVDMNKEIRSYAQAAKTLMSNMQVGQPSYDAALHVIWMTSQSDVVGIGKVQGLSGMIPTEKGMVMVHGYALDANFPTYAPMYRNLIASTKVSPELAYKPRWTDNVPVIGRFDTSRLFRSAVIGGIIGLLIALIAMRKRRR
jgi:hypothetical protein